MCDFPSDFLTAATSQIMIFFWLTMSFFFFPFLRMYSGDTIIIVTYYFLSFDNEIKTVENMKTLFLPLRT